MARIDTQILEGIIPSIVLSLVRQSKIAEKHLSDPKRLFSRFLRYRKEGIANTQLYTALESGFHSSAMKAWKEGEREIGIVLFATAIEQLLNGHYRFILEGRGFDAKEITTIIKSNNLEAKISWLFMLITRRRFPTKVAKRLNFIAQTRNAIVHYKAQPDHIDHGGGSHSHIEKQIESCKGWRLSDFYRKLDGFLIDVVCSVEPNYDVASKASQIILDERLKAKRRISRQKASVAKIARQVPKGTE